MKDFRETYRYDRFYETYQESRWAEPEELMQDLVQIDIEKPPYQTAGLPIISNGRTVYVDAQDHHSLIFGATGSKKSRLFIMPMIQMMANAGESYIVTDPKGELYQQTAGMAKSNGFHVVVVNFRDFLYSHRWNPLQIPYELYKEGKKDEAVGMLNDLLNSISADSMKNTKDIYWIQQANSLALALILILFETGKPEEINMGSFVKMCGEYGKPIENNLLYQIYEYVSPDSVAGMNLSGVMISAEKTKDSIMSSLHAMIRIFILQEKLISMMGTNDFDLRNIGREKTAVYIIIPDEKSTYHFLATMFIKQCYEILIQEAQKMDNIQLPRRVNFVLDEFANIPAIPEMDAMITAARSRNIRFFLVIQSFHQLKKIYGDNAGTLTSNCENWVYLNSKEFAQLEEISKLCGNFTTSDGMIRPLIAPSQLLHLSKKRGEALILAARHYPILTEMPDISQYMFPFREAPEFPYRTSEETVFFSMERLLDELVSGRWGVLFAKKNQKKDLIQEMMQTDSSDLKGQVMNQLEELIRKLKNYE